MGNRPRHRVTDAPCPGGGRGREGGRSAGRRHHPLWATRRVRLARAGKVFEAMVTLRRMLW